MTREELMRGLTFFKCAYSGQIVGYRIESRSYGLAKPIERCFGGARLGEFVSKKVELGEKE